MRFRIFGRQGCQTRRSERSADIIAQRVRIHKGRRYITVPGPLLRVEVQFLIDILIIRSQVQTHKIRIIQVVGSQYFQLTGNSLQKMLGNFMCVSNAFPDNAMAVSSISDLKTSAAMKLNTGF